VQNKLYSASVRKRVCACVHVCRAYARRMSSVRRFQHVSRHASTSVGQRPSTATKSARGTSLVVGLSPKSGAASARHAMNLAIGF